MKNPRKGALLPSWLQVGQQWCQRFLQFWLGNLPRRLGLIALTVCLGIVTVNQVWAEPAPSPRAPRQVVLISLDGATPSLLQEYWDKGILPKDKGLGLLAQRGLFAQRNETCNASLTAACHITIGTGSDASKNNITANAFHLVASLFRQTISGFGAPIGGYSLAGPGQATNPTAEPIWRGLLASGKKVVAATFPGADGVDVRLPAPFGSPSPILEPASDRTVTYTVPFGAFAGEGARGFSLTRTDFGPAPSLTVDQLTAAGKPSFSPVLQKTTPLNTFASGGVSYTIQVAALDTSNDGVSNYDTLVFFDAVNGIQPGPFSLPSTGPAYVKASDRRSSLFYLEGSPSKAGTGFYVTNLAPDLSTVRIVRYSANAIPRNAAVLADVDDINTNVGFWAPQADFRIPQRVSPGFGSFPDQELEAAYEDQVRLFVDYQTRVVLRAIARNPDADLVMTYIEQPDGSEHQFLLIDPRQATNFLDPTTIGPGQDAFKMERYEQYIEYAYQQADLAVQRIIAAVGTDASGLPKRDIIVVSDHGFSPFHTAVNINNLLRNAGIDLNKVRAVTSGPAANIYISLQGREPDGVVTPAEYVTLQQQVRQALEGYLDTNRTYTRSDRGRPIFDKVYLRPTSPQIGFGTSDAIGQDSGDVFATLREGYNFDGVQSVARLGDPAYSAATTVLNVATFYGAHGYDPKLKNMSAIFIAAGPDFSSRRLDKVRNIDVTPTINRILGVQSAPTVQGQAVGLK